MVDNGILLVLFHGDLLLKCKFNTFLLKALPFIDKGVFDVLDQVGLNHEEVLVNYVFDVTNSPH